MTSRILIAVIALTAFVLRPMRLAGRIQGRIQDLTFMMAQGMRSKPEAF
jgi:hypothetical protein